MRLEVISGWLALHRQSIRLRNLLIELICSLVLQHFRKDVFQAIRDNIRSEFQKDALAIRVMLCKTSLETVLLPQDSAEEEYELRLALENRAKVRSVKQLVDLL